MRKLILLVLISSLIPVTGWTQEESEINESAKNSLLLTFGGAGIYTSLIYERELYQLNNIRSGVRAGIGLSPFALTSFENFTFPVGIYALYGKNKHHIDLSVSLSNYFINQYNYTTETDSKDYKVLLIPSLTWRYQKPEGGLTFKAGLSPVLSLNKIKSNASPWIELAAGWAF
jgi:hypothetical protein